MRRLLIVLAALTAALPAAAQMHEHGAADIEIVVEDTTVELVLIVPGADFVGFEQAPESEEEFERIDATIDRTLDARDELYAFRTRRGVEVELVDFGIVRPESHEHDDHDEDEHHEEDHEDEGEHDEEHHDEHAEYRIIATYRVSDWTRVRFIDAGRLFNAMPSLTDIEWLALTPDGQSAGELSQGSTRIRL